MNAHDKFLEEPYTAAELDQERLQEKISAEAEALLAEWQKAPSAEDYTHNFELLMDERARIIQVTAFALGQVGTFTESFLSVSERDAAVMIGNHVIEMVRACALDVATFLTVDAL